MKTWFIRIWTTNTRLNQHIPHLKHVLWFGLGCTFFALGLWWFLRDTLLKEGWQYAQKKAGKRGLVLSCRSIAFEGLYRIRINDLSLTFEESPLLQIHETKATPSLGSLMLGSFRLQKLHFNRLSMNLVNQSDFCNYRNLLATKTIINDSRSSPVSEGPVQHIYHYISTSLDLLPPDFRLVGLNARYVTDTGRWIIQIPSLQYQGKHLQGSLRVNENGYCSGFGFDGTLNRSRITGCLVLKPLYQRNITQESNLLSGDFQRVTLPWVSQQLGLSAQMKSIKISVNQFEFHQGILEFDLQGSVERMRLRHPKLAFDTIVFPRCYGRLRGKANAYQIQIDSSSHLKMGMLPCRLYGVWSRGPQARLDLRIATSKIPANHFLSSLPKAMFRNLEGLKAHGRLHWYLSLQLEQRHPEQCRFQSALVGDQFRVFRMGNSNLARMNGPFFHTVYQNARPLRTLWIGPENPRFTPLNQIPKAMQQAIMIGEDGNFYEHRGFYPEAFRRSIAQNYLKGKFVRGGSTISMQLVKNVFLNQRKTIARKAEELLITWIIENQRITPKERMMEVYLNVIEFGNNIWGIGEASEFYFGKHPSALEPIECVFLAGLVPRPRVLQFLLESDGAVSPRNGNFFAIRNRLLRRGLLPPEDSTRVHVGLRKVVYQHVQPLDSLSLMQELEDSDELDL